MANTLSVARIHRHVVSQSAVWDDSIRNSQQVEGVSVLQIGPALSEKASGPCPGAPSHSFVPLIVSLFKTTFLFISAESFSSPSFSS